MGKNDQLALTATEKTTGEQIQRKKKLPRIEFDHRWTIAGCVGVISGRRCSSLIDQPTNEIRPLSKNYKNRKNLHLYIPGYTVSLLV